MDRYKCGKFSINTFEVDKTRDNVNTIKVGPEACGRSNLTKFFRDSSDRKLYINM